MLSKNYLKAEHRVSLVKKVLGSLMLRAFAEGEPDNGGNNGGDTGKDTVNFEQMVARARKEEKDKLYPRIQKLEEEKSNLVSSVNNYLLEIATLKKDKEELVAKGDNSKEVTELNAKIEALQEKNKTLQESMPKEETIRKTIRKELEQEYEVKLYLKDQLTANKETILTAFASGVTGKTKEEVDKSIKEAQEKSLGIKKELGLVDEKGNPIEKDNGAGKGNKKPPMNIPNDNEVNKEFDLATIQALDPSSKEYKEFRKKIGLK